MQNLTHGKTLTHDFPTSPWVETYCSSTIKRGVTECPSAVCLAVYLENFLGGD